MRHEDKSSLKKCPKLVGAGGAAIHEQGKGNFKLKLDPVSKHTEMIVADIDDDGMLGVDFVLQNEEDGPADLLMSKGVLKVADKKSTYYTIRIAELSSQGNSCCSLRDPSSK